MNEELSNTLSANFMLANLTIRSWSGKAKDKEASEELASQNEALSSAAEVVVSLLAGNDRQLRKCQAAYARIRTWFYANSLPWTSTEGQRGSRLIGTVQAMTFLRDFTNLVSDAEVARQEFIDSYDSAVQLQQTNLGKLYDPAAYPSTESLSRLFSATLDIEPMPAVADFDRIAIPGAMAVGLKGLYERRAKKMSDTAISDCQERMVKELARISTQLMKVVEGEPVRLHETLITNMSTLTALAESLGPLDSSLAGIAARVRRELLSHEVKDFKGNAALSRSIAEAADAIKAELSPAPVVDNVLPEPDPTPIAGFDLDSVFDIN